MTAKHDRTEDVARLVSQLAACGTPHDDIAEVIGISHVTLRKYYREELVTSAIKANAAVAGNLYQKAMQGDTSSMIFWLKTRAKWSETIKHEGGDSNNPIFLSGITVKLIKADD